MNQNLRNMIKNSEKCSSMLSKLKGFMFSLSKKPKLFIFRKEQPVQTHTFFCLFPLKIIYFNKNLKIVRKEIVKPFTILPFQRAKYILEIPYKK